MNIFEQPSGPLVAGLRPVMTATSDPTLQTQWEYWINVLKNATTRKDRRVAEHKLNKLAFKISRHYAANSGTNQQS